MRQRRSSHPPGPGIDRPLSRAALLTDSVISRAYLVRDARLLLDVIPVTGPFAACVRGLHLGAIERLVAEAEALPLEDSQ